MGLSSRDMMNAMIEGDENPAKLSAFPDRTLKKKKEELELALRGNMIAHGRIMLKTTLTHVDFPNEQIVELDMEVAKRLDPFQQDIERLDTNPGIAKRTAEQILAEIGTDVGSRFPSTHLCSWIGLVPRQNERAGERKSSKTRKGNKYLRSALIEVAHSVCRSDNYLGARYRRIAARKGRHRAALAVAYSIMTIVYHLLTRGEDYKDDLINTCTSKRLCRG